MNPTVLKQLYKNKQLRGRLLVVLAVLLAYSFISHIPVPVPDTARLQSFLLKLFQSNSLLGFANLFSGGTMSTFSIILMGLGPYINASIIIQLLTQVVPKFEALSKEGEQGRNKLNQYTRWLTVPLAMVQAIAMIIFVQQTSIRTAGVDLVGNPSLGQWFYMVTAITAGSVFLMWLGEIITDRGIGNG
ncbi:preprotein translocase subunit SecY, partial [bacterium]|nr:preprotein translocase subunit SecY [bacterium]